MGRFLDSLLADSPVYRIERGDDGFVLVGSEERLAEFSEIVREAADHAGDDYIVFPVTDGHQGYSQMFIIPLDGWWSHS